LPRAKNLQTTDDSVLVLVEFFTSMAGPSGKAVLQNLAKDIVAIGKSTKDIPKIETNVKKLQQDDVYRFVDSAGQNVVVNLLTFLRDLAQGKAPNFGAHPDDWTINIKTMLGDLCVAERGQETLKGPDAAVLHFTQAEAKYKAKKAKLADYQVPVQFLWLLEGGQQAIATARRRELMEKEKKSLADFAAEEASKGKRPGDSSGAASSSSASEPAAKKAKTELEIALSMFGRG